MDKILILPTRSNPKGRLYNLSKEEAEDIHKKLFSLKFNSENDDIIDYQEEIFDKYFNRDPNKYKEFLVELSKITPTKNYKLFVHAIKSKDYPLIIDLANRNITFKCFLKRFITQFKNCAEQEKEKDKCIQNVVNQMLKEEIYNYNLNYNLDCLRLLIEIGADFNDKDINGNTALIWASFKGYIDIVKLLLDKGADFNAKNINGNTALIQASKNNHIDIVKLLLANGANPDIKNIYGDTAINIAYDMNYKEIFEELLKYSKDRETLILKRDISPIKVRKEKIEPIKLDKEEIEPIDKELINKDPI